MSEYYSITYVYSIFFSRFSFSGHLGCFRVLAVVSNAAVNNGPHVSFWTMFLSGYMLNCGIAGWDSFSVMFANVWLAQANHRTKPIDLILWWEKLQRICSFFVVVVVAIYHSLNLHMWKMWMSHIFVCCVHMSGASQVALGVKNLPAKAGDESDVRVRTSATSWRRLITRTVCQGNWITKNISKCKWFRFLGQEDPLEQGMATHCSILA